MSIEQLMPFFESMSIEAQTKAYENLAYQLLDDYIYTYGEMAEERLMKSLSDEKQYQDEYKRWKETQNEPMYLIEKE